MPERPALYDLSHAQLSELLDGWGQPRFRADQVRNWLYRSLVGSPREMSNLPKELRARLASETDLLLLTPLAQQSSVDGQTRKVLFQLRDGSAIESVLMLYQERRTTCISTQVGCGMGCVFCATGQGDLARSLSPGEIVAQVIHFAAEMRQAGKDHTQAAEPSPPLPAQLITNVVFMGMGEPLASYEATWQAIETLTDPQGMNLGARRITLSTVGLVPGILRLAKEGLPVNLAISLHAPEDALRSQLVPINRRYPLADLMAAVREYFRATGRRVSFEYALIAGVNDSVPHARQLALLLRGLLCHVNLMPLNPTWQQVALPGLSPPTLRPSPRERVDAFRDELEAAGIPTTVRMRRGIDIEAGCGQLRQRRTGIADIAAR